MYQTTLSSWALLLSKAIEFHGVDSSAVFKRSGLDPAMLSDPNARYASGKMKKLWALAAEVTEDPCIGLRAASFWHPTTLHALGYAWMASSSLRDALDRLIRYLDVASTATHLVLEVKDGRVSLEFPFNPAYIPAIEALDAALAVLFDLCRTSCGDEFELNHVSLKRNAPDCKQHYVEYFQTTVQFSSDKNAIVFDEAYLDLNLPTANAELVQANDLILLKRLTELKKGDIVEQVSLEIVHLLPAGAVTEKLIAEKLNLSVRTLQRKLAATDTNFKVLLDRTRQQLALQYVQDISLSISEICYLLGFTEPANFTRAFKRWVGVSPSQYRSQKVTG